MSRRRKLERRRQLAIAVGEIRRKWIEVITSGQPFWKDEIIVDSFAGGGGASTGIEMATGRSVDEAINHDPAAIAMHEANHPFTRHWISNVWRTHPRIVAAGRKVGLLWLSPDCTHHSKARGGKPRQKNIRDLAWVAVWWAATVKPRVIMLENVEEFADWGPLDKNGQPIQSQKGRTFRCFVNALRYQGYDVEWRILRACDYGAPTTRKRLFLIARCDGQPIVWPEPTHADPRSPDVQRGKLKPYRTAAECIDWSIPCPSIFERERPLKPNTLRRIARGIIKFVVNNPNPFIAPIVGTVNDHSAQVAAFLAQYHTETVRSEVRGQPLDMPLMTLDTSNRYALVTAYIARHFGESVGHRIDEPLGTVTAGGGGKSALVAAHLVKFRGTNIGSTADEPIPTITAGGNHIGAVYAFLLKYYGAGTGQMLDEPLGTVTTKDRFGLVLVHIKGIPYVIVDIGMRMLEPRELYRAQGFPDSYIIAPVYKGRPFPKSEQVAKCGNSVSPVIPKALVRANLPEHCIGSGHWLVFERYTDRIGQLQLSM